MSHGYVGLAKVNHRSTAILDIGSGPTDGKHSRFNCENTIHVDVNRNAYHLEVQCDAHFLPFRSDCFDLVHISHVLEHVESPFQVLREVSRVSHAAIVSVPNASYYRLFSCSPEHIYGWTTFDFENLLRRHFSDVKVYGSYRIDSSGKGLTKKFKTLKTYILAFLFRTNELTAICRN